MKVRYLILLIIFMKLATSQVSAQNVSIKNDNLVWTVDQLTDVASDTTMALDCNFITYGNSKVVWVQQAGAYSIEFNVKSSDGSWSDLSSSGSMEFTVKYLDRKGKITFTRSPDGLFIAMNFIENGSNTMPFKFHVKSVTKKTL